ncbi:Get3/ArsA fold putative tail anchor-mediating ATPase NosAFP [Anthocerotibacter panamensis]|uniref:Get3/ArsA fold putative tail anchor-mediating ATPase NosAFP n=1 Tax=Anthocerotibacter panamensis TaxID=2857077 RepID=UPI001C408B74|nr:ArsA-related P-loop ATPase [Anthocerotibacter panamensis]
MSKTLVFLGTDGIRESLLALASARRAAQAGSRVLLIGQQASDLLGGVFDHPLKGDPIEVEPNLWVTQARTTSYLERSWNRIRGLEEEYLRTPFFKNVYGQELGVIPGFDELFLLLALRDWDLQYDVMVLHLSSDQSVLRLLAAPDQLAWYTRRFQEAFRSSPLSLALSPFLEPITRAVMAGSVNSQQLGQTGGQLTDLLQRAQQAARKQVVLFLVTDHDPLRVRQAQRLWGSAELFELQVAGVLDVGAKALTHPFDPLPVERIGLPQDWKQWEIPDFSQFPIRPAGLAVDSRLLTVRVFLPGFDKKEIELSQDGPELTLRVADQRRNLLLPPAFQGRRVRGAKFVEGALLISLG